MKTQAEIRYYLEAHEIAMDIRWQERGELDREAGIAIIQDRLMCKVQEYMKRFGNTQGWIAALKWVLEIPSIPGAGPTSQKEYDKLFNS